MVGLEITGVVLGVLPLFIKAFKVYSQDVKALREAAASQGCWTKRLTDFYYNFWYSTYFLWRELDQLVDSLPTLSEAKKGELRTRNLANWNETTDEELGKALWDMFPRADDYETFQGIMKGVMYHLSRLVKTSGLDKFRLDTKNPHVMIQKLKHLQSADQLPQSDFLQRFNFLRKQADLNEYLKDLEKWNRRLEDFIKRAAPSRLKLSSTVALSKELPSYTSVRELSRRLFASLHKKWECICTSANDGRLSAHDARFSLTDCACPKTLANDINDISFHFIISGLDGQVPKHWVEATIKMPVDASLIPVNYEDRIPVARICEATSLHIAVTRGLTLVVENADPSTAQTQSSNIWRAHSCDKILQHPHGTDSARSLKALLTSEGEPPLAHRRKLALMIAYSLLQLHESPWLGEQWEKSHLFFPINNDGLPDLLHPYMKTSFDNFPQSIETCNIDLLHQNPGILNLGILLIELHEWEALDSSISNPCAVQERAKVMKWCSPGYRKAIGACLWMNQWLTQGVRATLENGFIREGMYKAIISELEAEVDSLAAMPGFPT